MEALFGERQPPTRILNGEMPRDANAARRHRRFTRRRRVLAGCGLMELMMARMAESGAMQIMTGSQ